MKRLLFLCVLIILGAMVNAQDKIITIGQDTLHCRIVSIGSGHISYEQESANGYMVEKSIPMEQVATYFRMSKSTPNISWRPDRPWLFSIHAGGSWMPWLLKDVEDAPGYEKKLAKGFHLNASGYYLITRFFGAGIQYSFFHSGVEGEYPTDFNLNYPIYMMTSGKEEQYVNYIGTSVIFQQYLDKNKKIQLSETLSEGVIFYRCESQTSMTYPSSSVYDTHNSNALITGWTFGATFGISVEYSVLPYLSIGCGGNFLFGSLKVVNIERKDSQGSKDKMKGTELDDPLKISRIDYSFVLRIHF